MQLSRMHLCELGKWVLWVGSAKKHEPRDWAVVGGGNEGSVGQLRPVSKLPNVWKLLFDSFS